MKIAFSIVFEKLKITGILVNFGDFDWRQISLFSTLKHINRHSTVQNTTRGPIQYCTSCHRIDPNTLQHCNNVDFVKTEEMYRLFAG